MVQDLNQFCKYKPHVLVILKRFTTMMKTNATLVEKDKTTTLQESNMVTSKAPQLPPLANVTTSNQVTSNVMELTERLAIFDTNASADIVLDHAMGTGDVCVIFDVNVYKQKQHNLPVMFFRY